MFKFFYTYNKVVNYYAMFNLFLTINTGIF